MLHVHTSDFELAVQAVRDIYCPHSLTLCQTARRLDTRLDVTGPGTWPIVRLEYGAPINVDADYKDLLLIQKCTSGYGILRQGSREAAWRPGITLPASPNQGTKLSFSENFSQISLKLNKDRLERLCSRWLGYPLDRDLRFDLRPFSAPLERAWTATLALVESYGDSMPSLPPAAEAALEEFVLTLLLTGHSHNFTSAFEVRDRRPQSQLLRRAKQYIEENASSPITVSDIAEDLNTSVRALQKKFREERQTTPASYLRSVRLQRARSALLNPGMSTTVAEVALDFGFLHLGRFSMYYRETFGETPVTTLARVRGPLRKCRN